jgi:serine/threonine-protein kinase RsbW
MSSSPARTVELRIPSELGNETMAMALAESVAVQMGFSQDRVEDLKTAVAEACMNAIEHGNRLDANVKVVVVLTIEPTRLAIDVVDQGTEPIPEPPEPSIDRMLSGDLPSGGMGIYLIHHLMDEVEFSRESGGGNQLHMVIYMHPEGEVGRGEGN